MIRIAVIRVNFCLLLLSNGINVDIGHTCNTMRVYHDTIITCATADSLCSFFPHPPQSALPHMCLRNVNDLVKLKAPVWRHENCGTARETAKVIRKSERKVLYMSKKPVIHFNSAERTIIFSSFFLLLAPFDDINFQFVSGWIFLSITACDSLRNKCCPYRLGLMTSFFNGPQTLSFTTWMSICLTVNMPYCQYALLSVCLTRIQPTGYFTYHQV
jgi:hypothetical protein